MATTLTADDLAAIATAVWTHGPIRSLTDKAGFALSDAATTAIANAITAEHGSGPYGLTTPQAELLATISNQAQQILEALNNLNL
jgi:hypothetical protein